MNFIDLTRDDFDKFARWAGGYESGTDAAHTHALYVLIPLVHRLINKVNELETKIEALENPDTDEGSWGVYKEKRDELRHKHAIDAYQE